MAISEKEKKKILGKKATKKKKESRSFLLQKAKGKGDGPVQEEGQLIDQKILSNQKKKKYLTVLVGRKGLSTERLWQKGGKKALRGP